MKNDKKTVLVFGCTGTVGRHVLRHLTTRYCHVKGVLRNTKRSYPIPPGDVVNLKYVIADITDTAAVSSACRGVDTLFLLTPTHPDQVLHEKRIIKAAKERGVQRIVKISAPDINPPHLVEVSRWHRKIEDYLAASGMDFCCLRPYAYMQNWERNVFTIRHFNRFYGAMQDAPRNYVDARDVAEIAVRYLLQPEPLQGAMITVTGPVTINHYDMAMRLSTATGRQISYVATSSEKLKNILTRRARLPRWLTNHIVELDELAVRVPEPTSSTVEAHLHRKPRPLNAYLRENKAVFARGGVGELIRRQLFGR